MGHETSVPRTVYSRNPFYNRYLHGRESCIEGQSSRGGEKDDSFEEDSIDEFLGWPSKLLLTP